VHGIDSTQGPTFGDVTGHERVNAVPHHNSVFCAVLKHLPWDKLDEAVARHGAQGCARSFSFKDQLVAMLYAQLSGASSLRHVVAGLQSHANRLYHLGVEAPRRSSLSDANRDRPAAVFGDLLASLIGCAHRGLRRVMQGTTYLVDATSLPLNRRSADWARFSAQACGAKLHVVYDPDADCPIYAAVSAARLNDITAAKAMPIEAGATYVFDLGYYDYAWWAKLDQAGCRIVTRLKANTPLTSSETRPGAGGAILCDRIGSLPARQARSRQNPFHKPVREVQVRGEAGKVLRLLTNDLEAPAEEIAELYKRRWQIELFFRWVKQTLKITRFLGVSENAVRIQIAVALIAFLLLRLAQASQTAIASPLTFARLVRDNLMHLRSLSQLHKPPERAPPLPGQGVLFAT
jgi:Transposase DDE domain/Domain of unknown function (DUF4372)